MSEASIPSLPGYCFLEQIHNGTKTVVYRAVQTVGEKRPVVIKLLQAADLTACDLAQFRNQYTIAQSFNSPGIVHVHGLEPYGTGYALVMEDFGGVSLRDWIRETGAQRLPDVLTIALQLTTILHELHKNRIIHKDIKPANILIHPESKQVKLIDFSIAALLPLGQSSIAPADELEGTLAYIAPEQTGRMQRGIDCRADLYALGVTLFELLTGKLPFPAHDPVALVHCHLAKQPPLACDRHPAIPFIVAQIIAKLMSKGAENRYQTALALQHDLQRCLQAYKETGRIEKFELGTGDRDDRQYRSEPVVAFTDTPAGQGSVPPSAACPQAEVLMLETLTAHRTSTSTSTSTEVLDFATVLKAAEAIAGELVLEKLLDRLLHIILENVGAQKGCIVLGRNGELFIEAADTNQEESDVIVDATALTHSDSVCVTLIQYAARTQQSLVIADATTEAFLATDPYVRAMQPQSILCAPIVCQGKFLGVVYLENNLMTGAFTGDRLELVKILASQAAIAIENARLYQQSQEREQFLRSLYDGLENQIFVFDILDPGLPGQVVTVPEIRLQGWNAATERAAGIKSKDVAGRTPEAIFGPVEGLVVRQHVMDCLAAGAAITYEECLTFSEVETWWLTTLNPLKNSANQIYRVVGTTFQISDRKQSEALLRQSEARNRAILSALPDMMFGYNAEGVYTDFFPSQDCDPAVSPDLFLGKTLQETLPPDIAQQILAAIQRALATREVQMLEYQLELGGQCHTYEARLIAYEADQVLQIVRDISEQEAALRERIAAETALRESEQRFRDVTEAAGDYIWEIDANSIYTYLTEKSKQVKGYAPEQLLGRSPIEVMHPDDIASVGEILTAASARKGSFTLQHRDVLPNGEVVWEEISGLPLLDDRGEIIGFRGTGLSITDRKRTELEIQQKNQALEQALSQLQQSQAQVVQSEKMSALGNLVAGVAHEINNPIGFLNGSISNARDYVKDLLEHLSLYQQHHPNAAAPIQEHAEDIDLEFLSEDLPKLLQSMKGATDRIKGISTSLRTFSRSDTEYAVSANLHEGLDSTILILKYRLKANEHRPAIEVLTDYGNVPTIQCFPGQLNQVFMNILANAIDMFDEMAQTFGSETVEVFKMLAANPQRITIATTMLNAQVQIRIRDNGKGMTKEVQARVFDHLFTTKGVGKGTGLGLAIARQIIEETHGGAIAVHSTLGEGTEFIIQLPLQPETSGAVVSHSQGEREDGMS